jgi:Protein of unknown function (DUF2846)
MTFARRALAAAALAVLAACASVPMAAPDRDFAAKEFAKPSRGKAALYVFRNESIGGTVKMTLQLDGAPLGETGPKTFHWVTIAPGKHTLVGKAENESVVQFTAASGQNVFVWQEVKMGFLSAGNRLELVDEQTGRAGVADCEMAEATPN